MKLLKTVRLGCDLALWAVAAQLVLGLFRIRQSFLLPWLLCVAGYALTLLPAGEKRLLWRALPLALPACALLCGSGPGGVLLLAGAAAYTAYSALARPPLPSHGQVADRFTAGGIGLAVGAALGLLTGAWNLVEPVWALVYLAGCVFLLRVLRHEEAVLQDRRFLTMNALALASVCVLGWALTSPAVLALMGQFLWGLWTYLCTPVIIGFLQVVFWVIVAVAWLIQQLLPAAGERPRQTLAEMMGGMPELDVLPENGGAAWPGWLRSAAVVLGAALLLFAAWRFLRGRERAGNRDKMLEGESEQRESLAGEDAGGQRPGLAQRMGARRKVRALYAKALRLLARHDVALCPGDTSADVEARARRVLGPTAADALRPLYLPARYSGGQVTVEQARRAKEAYRALKKQLEP